MSEDELIVYVKTNIWGWVREEVYENPESDLSPLDRYHENKDGFVKALLAALDEGEEA